MCIYKCFFYFIFSRPILNNDFVTSLLVVYDDPDPPEAQVTVTEDGRGVYLNTGRTVTEDRNHVLQHRGVTP